PGCRAAPMLHRTGAGNTRTAGVLLWRSVHAGRSHPMDQKIIDLYDNFTHGGMNRRQFLDRLTEGAGSKAAALALLPLLQTDNARAAIVAPDDARLASERAAYDSPKDRID